MPDDSYLETDCIRCSGHIEYPAELAGQPTECPHCLHSITLPPAISLPPLPRDEPLVSDQRRSTCPELVHHAVAILYFSLGLGVLGGILAFRTLSNPMRGDLVSEICFGAAGFFMVVLAVMILELVKRGKNWARLILVVLILLGLPLVILPTIYAFTRSPVDGFLRSAQIILQIAAVVLLLHRESSGWFEVGRKLK